MGVSGCGKSTIGKLLAEDLKIPFFDGDDYHPKENIEKMSKGIPLNDEDRLGWLQTLNSLAKEQLNYQSCVIVCSALKESYRKILSKHIENVTKWVHLSGTFSQIQERINKRSNHFMSSKLLQSQFDTLETPTKALTLNICLKPEEIVKKIKNNL